MIFGIVFGYFEIGYGYIYWGVEFEVDCFEVDFFVEKLDLDIVKVYLLFGDYLWNSGMFMFLVCVYLKELEIY